jgi:benzoate-CoA ligase family protein
LKSGTFVIGASFSVREGCFSQITAFSREGKTCECLIQPDNLPVAESQVKPVLDLPDQFNVATYFIDRNVQEGRSNKIAVECGEQRISYGQLLERVNRLGNALRALGVRPEERVLMLLPDIPEFLYSFFGIIKIGAVAVPVNTLLRPHEYEYIVNDTRARVAIVSDGLLPQLEQIATEKRPYLKQIIVAGEIRPGHEAFGALLDRASAQLAAEPSCKDDAAFWLYSSGSTGPPKGCVHLHHDMVVCSEYYAKGILSMTEQDRCYSVAKLFFAYGLGNAGYYPLFSGATTILSPSRPTPEAVFANIERYRPTLFFSVPTNYAALLAHKREQGGDFDLSGVRYAISAGEPLPAPLFHRFKERFGVEILDALGSTEMLQMVISNRPGDIRPGSSGKVIPGFKARIVDESDNDVSPGEIGNLLVQSDATCAGYWNQHEKTKNCFVGPWFRTGDKYYQDEDGFFWYAGRGDDLFKVNGRWLSPAEVESALISHPAVLEAAVVARQDDDGLLKPAAYVVLNPDQVHADALAEELQNWVGQNLSTYKRPRWVEFVSELPKTATGKLQRFKLRALHSERHE